METFPCQLTIMNMPTDVSAHDTVSIEAHVEIFDPSITLGFILLSIPATGELLRFAKKEDKAYILSYTVPYAPAGTYSVSIYAMADNGLRTAPQNFDIRIL
ncbi:MAG: hypothetical protein ACOX8S_07465 [Christensenellales bacterium]|jgi:hypothetical protein